MVDRGDIEGSPATKVVVVGSGFGRDVFHPPLALRYAASGPNQHGVEQGS